MLCLFTQLQKKLQLDYKTNVTQNHQKIKLHRSLTTKNLKKPHSFRQVGRAEMWRGTERCGAAKWCGEAVEQVVPHSRVVDKNWKGCFRNKRSQAQTLQPSSPGVQHHEDKSP